MVPLLYLWGRGGGLQTMFGELQAATMGALLDPTDTASCNCG